MRAKGNRGRKGLGGSLRQTEEDMRLIEGGYKVVRGPSPVANRNARSGKLDKLLRPGLFRGYEW